MSSLVERYGLAHVPRYTSYPTAPHFHGGIDAAEYRRWLGNIALEDPLSLYLHVPFCREMCWYCGCHTKVTRRYDPVARYIEALVREIDLVAEALPGRRTVRHIHWGGGSPNRLTRDDFTGLMADLRRCFHIAEDAEVAVEIDPRGFEPDDSAAYAWAGVNRVSLGVQTFDPAVQAAINRVQPFEQVAGVVDSLRAAGITAINIDLMYGLPHQTEASVRATVADTVRLSPDRLAVFGYAHVPWMKAHMRLIDEATLPGIHDRFAQAEAIRNALGEHGYVPVGLDHFASPDDPLARAVPDGSLSRNFQGYTTDAATSLIGLGASAIGSLADGYVQNAPDMGTYERSMAEGTLATARGIALSADDRMRRGLIETLMCFGQVDMNAASGDSGLAPDGVADALERLQPLIEDGIVWRDGNRVGVTDEGRPFIRSAAACFDAYLGQSEARHSKAV